MVGDDSRQQYYHGTNASAALCISLEGFCLHDENRGGGQNMLGYGTYVTANAIVADSFGDFIFRVRLAPGTRILWLDGHYDRRVIDSLRREFGAEVLGYDFGAAIPTNKHLRRIELITLLNYLWMRFDRLDIPALPHAGPLRRLLVKFGYDALGCPANYAGVVVFNPSRVLAGGLFQMRDGSQELRPVAPPVLAHEASRAILRLAWLRPGDERIVYLQNFLRIFCSRHGLPTDVGQLATALDKRTASGPSVESRSF